MLCSKMFDRQWLNTCTKNLGDKENAISNLIWFFIFYHFQHSIFFLTTHLYSRQNIIITFFFINFRLTLKKYFFSKKTNTTLIFLIFFYSKINYPIMRKEQNEEPFFLYFFSRIQNTFFWFWQKSNFRVLMTSWNLLT